MEVLEEDMKYPGCFESEEVDSLFIGVDKSKGIKCARCWVYSHEVGKDEKYRDVCPRCAEVLKKL